ncbi:uncharacterized protein LOC116415909 [Nasonia vitripennis]|uniref:Uncharacterized protein n=1 Tax=Nasonia vitripennis TaxID=7425 RepID=A0A7M7PUX2_NASVI|nr:uncharacterized protein LOC116415909 [Nasonia vitripennis]
MGLIGKTKKIALNYIKKYSYEEVKSELLKQYIDDDNKYHFRFSVSCLGKSDGTCFLSFEDSTGKACDFWAFCHEKIRNKSHCATIFLLTTKVKGLGAELSNQSEKKVLNSVLMNIQQINLMPTIHRSLMI